MKEGIMTKSIAQETLHFLTTLSNLMVSSETSQAKALLEQKLLPFWYTQFTELWASIQKMGI